MSKEIYESKNTKPAINVRRRICTKKKKQFMHEKKKKNLSHISVASTNKVEERHDGVL